jgi:hypothetical protein
VSVTGPAYQGWRPPIDEGGQEAIQYDPDNQFAPSYPQLYGGDSAGTDGVQSTSTMVVEVQIQNEVYNKLGLEGDLAWETTSQGPVLLPPTFSGSVYVTWGNTGGPGPNAEGVVTIPDVVTSSVKMRLRISEIDYYGSGVPAVVDTTNRRPFVCFVPLN